MELLVGCGTNRKKRLAYPNRREWRDLVTLDMKMPGFPGTKVLEKVKQRDPDIEAIIITGYGSMDTAIEGLRLGAFDYIAKPFDVDHVLGSEAKTGGFKLQLLYEGCI